MAGVEKRWRASILYENDASMVDAELDEIGVLDWVIDMLRRERYNDRDRPRVKRLEIEPRRP